VAGPLEVIDGAPVTDIKPILGCPAISEVPGFLRECPIRGFPIVMVNRGLRALPVLAGILQAVGRIFRP
jgi:hypothetical protein